MENNNTIQLVRQLGGENITTDNTKVMCNEIHEKYNAPHDYMVLTTDETTALSHIHFQEGPVEEYGLNGIFHEDLIAIVIDRLENFQNSNYKCDENQKAICLLQDTLEVLRSRTNKRIDRGVQGTSVI